jgi:hypothetical protein
MTNLQLIYRACLVAQNMQSLVNNVSKTMWKKTATDYVFAWFGNVTLDLPKVPGNRPWHLIPIIVTNHKTWVQLQSFTSHRNLTCPPTYIISPFCNTEWRKNDASHTLGLPFTQKYRIKKYTKPSLIRVQLIWMSENPYRIIKNKKLCSQLST